MESIHIDYKAGKALSGKAKEISKDISAFANSDGGYVIYGVSEKEHLPTSIDEGVDHKAKGRKKGSTKKRAFLGFSGILDRRNPA